MYIALYDSKQKHISNVTNITYDKTERTYDMDSFSAEGISTDDIKQAKVIVVNDEYGNYRYACFADSVTPKKKKCSIKGIDFKTLWDTEILLDYTAEGSFNGKLSAIFTKVKELVFDTPDAAVHTIPVDVEIPTDNTDTTGLFGSNQGTYKITNAYTFLKCYLKYYGYMIETKYDISNGRIKFSFVRTSSQFSTPINLRDFIHELTTTASTTNKAVATIKYDASKGARPTTISTYYYYLTDYNTIVRASESGLSLNRIYPVKTKWFESENLADAQFDAVYELANSRYVDNIVIDNNAITDPVDLSEYSLGTMFSLYYDGVSYKTLPISEKITTLGKGGESVKIKLGYKKILLTEIIKG